jgi:superfamily II DNA or RNA helicase
MTYNQFLSRKAIVDVPTGFDADTSLFPSVTFPFQRDIIKWACRRGRAALFEDCGLGKTLQQLAWAEQVVKRTGKPVLILAPNEVKRQTIQQGKKFGIEVHLASGDADVVPGINITNYEKLHRFNVIKFGGVVLDESSILKAYDGATRELIITSFERTPYKLACTATPAPNDFMELGNHAEFLGVMSRTEMLTTFFVHDGGETSKWRLKRHAQKDFWRWLCSWAVNIRKPSDLGYDDAGFNLPPIAMSEHVVESEQAMNGYLFALPASSMQERREARKGSLSERVDQAVKIAKDSTEQWVFWCNLNAESEAIAKALKATEVRGSTSEADRDTIASDFASGTLRRVVTKPGIWGFGMNLQFCNNTVLVGLSDSYEEFYQVIRRFWRFGQTKEVKAHIVISHLEGAVLKNIHRKEHDAQKLADEMIAHMCDISSAEIKSQTRETINYEAKEPIKLPKFIS